MGAYEKYVVFADDEFNNGSAWFCIDKNDGAVYRIDIELDEPIEYVNSSKSKFIESIKYVANWFKLNIHKVKSDPSCCGAISKEISVIDSEAMKSAKYFWSVLIDYICVCAKEPDIDFEEFFKFGIT